MGLVVPGNLQFLAMLTLCQARRCCSMEAMLT